MDRGFEGRRLEVLAHRGWDDYKGVDVRGKTLVMLHEAEHAGWPFSVALSDAGREDFDIKDQAEPRFPVDSIIPVEKARELFHLTGHDFDSLRKLA